MMSGLDVMRAWHDWMGKNVQGPKLDNGWFRPIKDR